MIPIPILVRSFRSSTWKDGTLSNEEVHLLLQYTDDSVNVYLLFCSLMLVDFGNTLIHGSCVARRGKRG